MRSSLFFVGILVGGGGIVEGGCVGSEAVHREDAGAPSRIGGGTDAGTSDAAVPNAPGSGGVTGAGGATGTGGAMSAGGSLSILFEEAEQYASCASNDDCHIVWTSCTCTPVSTRVAELVDPRICGTNACLGRGHYPTDVVCQGETCTLVLDPPCYADADCLVLWARCPNTDQVERDCACAAAHVLNSTTRNLVSPDGECYRVKGSTSGHAICESGYCTLVSP